MSEEMSAGATRVVRSFAFVDLSGFTSFTNNEGDDEAVAVLREFRDAVRDAASSRGVRIAKWLGDGAMLVGVETEPLIQAVVDIENRISRSDSALPLRAGISVGPVILFEGDDYIGHAVNVAARLCDEAAPRGVIAVAEAAESPIAGIDAEPAGEREIRGIDEPVAIVRLTVRG